MKISSLNREVALLQRARRVLSFVLAVGAVSATTSMPSADAASHSKTLMRSRRISVAEANRIARNYIGGSA